MLKMEKEYNELYGDVPIDSLERIDYLLENTKGHLYCVVYFDLDYMYLDKLKERNILWK